MAKNYTQSGNVITVTAPSPVVGGEGIVIEKLFGIATHAAQAGEELELSLVGVFRLPKDGTDISLGQRVYWNKTANVTTTTASSNTLVGVATEDAAISAKQVNVRMFDLMQEPQPGDKILYRGRYYRVVKYQPDGQGSAVIYLHGE